MIECYFGNVTLNRQILVPVLDYSMIGVMWFGFNRRMIWIYGQQNRSRLNFSVLGLVFHTSLIVAWSEPVQGLTSLLVPACLIYPVLHSISVFYASKLGKMNLIDLNYCNSQHLPPLSMDIPNHSFELRFLVFSQLRAAYQLVRHL